MMFAALTSAMIVRKGSSLDWQKLHAALDPLLQYAAAAGQQRYTRNSRRRVASFMGGVESPGESPARWLYVTLGLGLALRGRPVHGVGCSCGPGILSRNQSQQFIFLSVHGHSCAARIGRFGGLIYVIGSSVSLNCGGARWMRHRATGISWTFFGCICSCCFG